MKEYQTYFYDSNGSCTHKTVYKIGGAGDRWVVMDMKETIYNQCPNCGEEWMHWKKRLQGDIK